MRLLGNLRPYKQAHGDNEADREQAQQADIGIEEFVHHNVHFRAPLRRPYGWVDEWDDLATSMTPVADNIPSPTMRQA